MANDMLAQALREAALRHGARVTVATSAADALSPAPGHALVAVSMGTDAATASITRGPTPHEGGALHVHQIDAVIEEGRLRTATLDWIEAWAADMAAIGRHGQAMAIAGATFDDAPPWGVRIDAAAHAVLASAGHDAGRLIADAGWRRSDSGFTARIVQDGLEADVDRYLDLVRFPLMRITRPEGDVQYEQVGDEVVLSIGCSRPLPETLLMAAEGRPLSCIVSTDAAEPPDNVIRTVVQGGGTIDITTDTAPRRISIPTKEKTA